ncbi:hypothetical protein EMIHUDRAFT_212131 [Emiliania huxleyi CCMP1516]|uniref:Uncharacterized protein n=2 Tax=Emiliania huxleyi TaxID=2903 RepID=A0A0D3IS86_EMIH1|nr:hypothetical protein EMIHUDRAFT_212131 [Emiliania huxleyi CCMP1516]EOD14121.1 hypothetical protein EMIHUDRAFT_212131 [Emiliania huxleyi CCMP1516]|eukprot:XP_005766550.1 hypothetical protein EMIHUDRAFT_212131 [Emiliania huxleyi CCMP1516]
MGVPTPQCLKTQPSIVGRDDHFDWLSYKADGEAVRDTAAGAHDRGAELWSLAAWRGRAAVAAERAAAGGKKPTESECESRSAAGGDLRTCLQLELGERVGDG